MKAALPFLAVATVMLSSCRMFYPYGGAYGAGAFSDYSPNARYVPPRSEPPPAPAPRRVYNSPQYASSSYHTRTGAKVLGKQAAANASRSVQQQKKKRYPSGGQQQQHQSGGAIVDPAPVVR